MRRNTSAWIRLSAKRCSASAPRTPWSCARPKASSATRSCGCGIAEARGKKKARHEAGRVTGGTVKRARLSLLQTRPVDQSDLVRTQIEVASEQSFDVLRLVALLGRLIHFHDSAELLVAALGGFTGQNEVRVILDAHGAEAYRPTFSDVCDWLHSLSCVMIVKMCPGTRAVAALLTYFFARDYRDCRFIGWARDDSCTIAFARRSRGAHACERIARRRTARLACDAVRRGRQSARGSARRERGAA